jgi:hypothetical protein
MQPDPARIRAHAERFDVRRFGPEVKRAIDSVLARRRA